MDPHEVTIPFPCSEDLALKKPCSSSYVESFARNVVVCTWVRGREPNSNFLPQLIICVKVLDRTASGTSAPQTLHPVDFVRHPLHSDLGLQSVLRNTLRVEPYVLRAWRIFSVDAFPSTRRIVKLTEKRHRRACVPSITTFTVFIRP